MSTALRNHVVTALPLVTLSIAALVAIGIILPQGLRVIKRRSEAKERVGAITEIARAIERYRAASGRLPTATEFRRSEPSLAAKAAGPHVTVALVPPHYVIEERELTLDTDTVWRVVDGRWDRWPDDIPAIYIKDSQAALSSSMTAAPGQPN